MNQDKTKTIILVIVIVIVIAIAAWYFFFAKRAEKFVPYSELTPAAREDILNSMRPPANGGTAPVTEKDLKPLAPKKGGASVSDAERDRTLKSLTPP